MSKVNAPDNEKALMFIKDDIIKDVEMVHGSLAASLCIFDAEINGFWHEEGRKYAIEAIISDATKKLSRIINELCKHTGRQSEIIEQ